MANQNERLPALGLGMLMLAWLGSSLYVLATRILHDLGQATLRRVQRDGRKTRALRRLPRRTFEVAVYRPPLFWAHLCGTTGFLRGVKHWDRFERNERHVPPLPAR